MRILSCISLLVISAEYNGYPGPYRGIDGMSESDRIPLFEQNGYSWPPTESYYGWPPVSIGPEDPDFRRSRDQIEAWTRKLENSQDIWDNWMMLVQSRILPALTPVGFKVIQGPEVIWQKLYENYHNNLDTIHVEASDRQSGVQGSIEASFIHQQELNDWAMEEMKPIMEEWAGMELSMGQSYGIRVYRNGSSMVNHVDRSETHVISCIFHIDHDTEEPWPLEIEDHQGNIHALDLQPGQVALYESAKMYHSRLTKMNGRHYGSLFIHYYPTHGWNWTMLDMIPGVPPSFRDTTLPEDRKYIYSLGDRPIDKYVKEYAKSQGAPMHVVDRLHGLEKAIFITLTNKLDVNVEVYWVNKDTSERVLNTVLKPSEENVLTTFDGHMFVLSREGHSRDRAITLDRKYGMFQDMLIDSASFSHDEL